MKVCMNHEKYNERILVVPRTAIMDEPHWRGIKEIDPALCITLIKNNQQYHPRGLMEEDVSFKQIIPYIVFEYQDLYFLMQRSSQATEQRLADLYTLGIGGHIRQEDIQTNDLVAWAQREFEEEISYNGSYSVEIVGMINDDFVPVGKYHVGIAMIFHADSNEVAVKSELASGTLLPLEEIMHFHASMESWSQIILSHLLDHKYGSGGGCCCGK